MVEFLTGVSEVKTACVKSLDAIWKYALVYVKLLLLGRKDNPRTYCRNIGVGFSDVSCIYRKVPCNSMADAHFDDATRNGLHLGSSKKRRNNKLCFFAILVVEMTVI